jgi:hypothetical protein
VAGPVAALRLTTKRVVLIKDWLHVLCGAGDDAFFGAIKDELRQHG